MAPKGQHPSNLYLIRLDASKQIFFNINTLTELESLRCLAIDTLILHVIVYTQLSVFGVTWRRGPRQCLDTCSGRGLACLGAFGSPLSVCNL